MVAAPDYTVDNTGTQGANALSLVASVYRHTLSPNSQNTLQPNDIIAILDEEMRHCIVPLILAAQEEFYVTNYDQTLTAGTYNYTIPKRAAFATWRDVVFVDSNGVEVNLSALPPEYVKLAFPSGGNIPLYVFGFVMVNDQIQLWPQTGGPPTQYKLRMKVKRRPNTLTSTSNCGQITAINGNIVTVGNADSTWTTSTTFDIIPNSPQFTSRGDDLMITNLASANTQITFSSLPSTVVVGDWVCPSQMSPIPQIPFDMFPLLAQRGVIRVLEALGDTQNLQIAERRYQDMAADFARTVSPRIEGTPKKIVNRQTPPFWGSYGFPFQR